INNNAMNRSNFVLPQGPNSFGYASYGIPNSPLTGFNFKNSLTPKKVGPLGSSFGVKAGKSFSVGAAGKLNLFASANFDSNFQFREGLNQSMNAQGARLKSFQHEKSSQSTNTTGMFNANYQINQQHNLA